MRQRLLQDVGHEVDEGHGGEVLGQQLQRLSRQIDQDRPDLRVSEQVEMVGRKKQLIQLDCLS